MIHIFSIWDKSCNWNTNKNKIKGKLNRISWDIIKKKWKSLVNSLIMALIGKISKILMIKVINKGKIKIKRNLHLTMQDRLFKAIIIKTKN